MNQTLSANIERLRLSDENEQLRIQLEAALEENMRLTEDRDRLLKRVATIAQELKKPIIAAAQRSIDNRARDAAAAGEAARSAAEEELRVAFEELQDLTQELGVANNSLLQANTGLESRVAMRTREIANVNAALRRSEAALQAVANVVPDLLWRCDGQGQIDWVNLRWSAFTGKNLDQVVREGYLTVLHPEDQDGATQVFERSISTGVPYQREYRMRNQQGEYRWFLARMEPLRDERGEVVQWYGAAMDIQDQRMSLDALQASETRFRTLVEGMPQLVWQAKIGGEWTWASPQWRALTGQMPETSQGRGWLGAFHPDDRAEILMAWDRAPQTGDLVFEGRIYSVVEKRYRHFKTRAAPVREDSQDIREWLGTSTDVDDLLQLQCEQTVLVSELQHRTRNLMAVVQAIIINTVRRSDTMEDFTPRIEARMQALARVQTLLSGRASGMRISIDKLLREELSAHAVTEEIGGSGQVMLSGLDDILLRSSAVQTFALALHELTTNAIKYGALSQPEGHLHIEWNVVDRDDGHWLDVRWTETGVENVPDPQSGANIRMGYGRELIERALPYQLGAKTAFAFTAEGIECNIQVRLD